MAWLTRARFLLGRVTGLLPGHEGRPVPVDLIPRAIHVGGRADLPRRLNPRCLYLVGAPLKWAIFRCPCGTGHQIDLNLAHAGGHGGTSRLTRRTARACGHRSTFKTSGGAISG